MTCPYCDFLGDIPCPDCGRRVCLLHSNGCSECGRRVCAGCEVIQTPFDVLCGGCDAAQKDARRAS